MMPVVVVNLNCIRIYFWNPPEEHTVQVLHSYDFEQLHPLVYQYREPPPPPNHEPWTYEDMLDMLKEVAAKTLVKAKYLVSSLDKPVVLITGETENDVVVVGND